MRELSHFIRRTVLLATVSLSASGIFASPSISAAGLSTVQQITLQATGTNQPGGAVTVTAQSSASGGSVLYDFWVQGPNGQWKQVQSWSLNSTYTLTNLQNGSYNVVVDALTPEQLQSQKWSAINSAIEPINVNTSVAITNISHIFNSPNLEGITPGQAVTITAHATNITNPVYQFWIEENNHWIGSNYAPSPTFTFTPTTTNFVVAVYAKTVDAPNTAGSHLGLTPVTATTPQIWAAQDTDAQAAQLIWQAAVSGAAILKGTHGVLTPTIVGAPSITAVAPLLPTSLPPNGTITGASSLLQANPQLLSQAQALAQPRGVTITPQILLEGMKVAAKSYLALGSNDPLAYFDYLEPGQLGSWIPGENPSSLPIQLFAGVYDDSVALHNYTYTQNVAFAPNTTYPAPIISGAAPQTPVPAIFPQRILTMTVPMSSTEVNSETNTSLQGIKTIGLSEGVGTLGVKVGLYPDPLAPGGVQWGFINQFPGMTNNPGITGDFPVE